MSYICSASTWLGVSTCLSYISHTLGGGGKEASLLCLPTLPTSMVLISKLVMKIGRGRVWLMALSVGSSNLGNNLEITFQTHFAHHQSKVDRSWCFWNRRASLVFMTLPLKFPGVTSSADGCHPPTSGMALWVPWEMWSPVSLSPCLPQCLKPRPPKSWHRKPLYPADTNRGISMSCPKVWPEVILPWEVWYIFFLKWDFGMGSNCTDYEERLPLQIKHEEGALLRSPFAKYLGSQSCELWDRYGFKAIEALFQTDSDFTPAKGNG